MKLEFGKEDVSIDGDEMTLPPHLEAFRLRIKQRTALNAVGLSGSGRGPSIALRAKCLWANLTGKHGDPLATQRRGEVKGIDQRVMRIAFGYLRAHDRIHLIPIREDGRIKSIVYDVSNIHQPFFEGRHIRPDALGGATINRGPSSVDGGSS